MKKYSLLLILVLLGAILRVVDLGKYPAGFNPDEADFGYNAYSILKTGSDEWGTPWYKLPFTNLRSFGEYKLPLYAFLTIPSISLLGLTEFATRLPNAIVGTLAIVAVYFLVQSLKWPQARLSAFFMAVSPWAVGMSRGAFEANLATFFIPAGLALYLSGFWWAAAFVLGLNFYTYHSARFFTPILVLLVAIFFPKKTNLKFLILFFALCLPGLISFVGKSSSRITDVGIFHPTDNWQAVSDRRFTARITGLPDSLARIFSNKPVYLASEFSKNYLSFLSPQFLFTQGAGEATYGLIPGRGLLYYILLPLLIYFVIMIVKQPQPKHFLIIACFLISLLPAALSKGPGLPGNRTVIALPFIILMCAQGFENLIKTWPNYKKVILLAVILLTGFQAIFFVEDYFFHSQFVLSRSMNYGWAETLKRALPISERYNRVRVSRSLSEPHIFVAFYSAFPPQKYQSFSRNWLVFEEKGLAFLDQFDGYFLDKFRFGDLNYGSSVDQPTLYIGKPEEFPKEVSGFFQVNYPDGTPAFKVAEKLPTPTSP